MSAMIALSPRYLIRVGSAILGLASLIALAVALGFAAKARNWLGFTFPGIPEDLGEAAAIFANNVKLAAGVGVATLIAQSRWLVAPGPAEPRGAHEVAVEQVTKGIMFVCDGVIAIILIANIAIDGASLGAYGWRMVEVMLPHGPFELGGYCVALNVYIQGRRAPLPPATLLIGALSTLSLLAVAAGLETFAQLR